MREYLLVLHGKPKPMKAHRDGAGGKKYDPLAYEKKLAVAQLMKQCQDIGKVLDGPLEIELYFDFCPPNSASKVKSDQMVLGDIKHTVKPDVDNLQKALLDILKRCIIKDDQLVYKITAQKRYSYEPKTVIIIRSEN